MLSNASTELITTQRLRITTQGNHKSMRGWQDSILLEIVRICILFNALCPKMVRHTLKIVQHLLQDFKSMTIFAHYALKALSYTEAYLRPRKPSIMELFAKLVNG